MADVAMGWVVHCVQALGGPPVCTRWDCESARQGACSLTHHSLTLPCTWSSPPIYGPSGRLIMGYF